MMPLALEDLKSGAQVERVSQEVPVMSEEYPSGCISKVQLACGSKADSSLKTSSRVETDWTSEGPSDVPLSGIVP